MLASTEVVPRHRAQVVDSGGQLISTDLYTCGYRSDLQRHFAGPVRPHRCGRTLWRSGPPRPGSPVHTCGHPCGQVWTALRKPVDRDPLVGGHLWVRQAPSTWPTSSYTGAAPRRPHAKMPSNLRKHAIPTCSTTPKTTTTDFSGGNRSSLHRAEAPVPCTVPGLIRPGCTGHDESRGTRPHRHPEACGRRVRPGACPRRPSRVPRSGAPTSCGPRPHVPLRVPVA